MTANPLYLQAKHPATRWIGILLLLLLTNLAFGGIPGKGDWSGVIRLRKDNYTLKQVLHEFQKVTGFRVAYDTKKVSPGTRIRIAGGQLTAKMLMALIKEQTGITYRARGIYVVMVPTLKQRVFKTKRIVILEDTSHYIPQVDSAISTTVVDTLLPLDIPDSIQSTRQLRNFLAQSERNPKPSIRYYRNIDDLVHDRPMDKSNMYDSYLDEQGLLELGATANEIYMFAPTVQVGFRFLHLVGTFYRHNGGTYWRAGLASVYRFNRKFEVQGAFSFGKALVGTSSYLDYYTETILVRDTTGGDTTTKVVAIDHYNNYEMGVRSAWNSIGISFKYQYNKHLFLSAGITYNQLKSNYTINHIPGNQFISPVDIPEKSIPVAVRPPNRVTTTETSPFSTRLESWIGFQVGIFYSF